MVKRIVAIIICVLAGIACCTMYVNYSTALTEKDSLSRELADMENKVALLEAHNTEKRTEVMSSVGGIDERRLNDDKDYIKNVMSIAFTWSSYEEYNNMRKTLVNDHGFAEDCQFLTDVFGFIPTSEYDSEYNYIDQKGLKVEFASCNTYCTGITGSDYHYFGEVTWRILGEAGGSVTASYGFTATINADGKISELFVMDAE